MTHRELFPGQFIRFATNGHGRARHWFGGEHRCEGAWCWNCNLPLMLHLTLDCADPLLNLADLPCRNLRLFYCMRCALCWYDVSYRIVSDDQVEIIEGFKGQTTWDDWYADGGADVFERRPLRLRPIPSRLQELYDRLNDDEDLSDAEAAEVASFTGNYACPEAGGYPLVDVINQLGGRSFLPQRLDDPLCHGCRLAGLPSSEMYFLASLTNDPDAGVKFTYDGCQIVFFLCVTCGTVKVTHSA